MNRVRLSLVSLVLLAATVSGDGTGHHHGHREHHGEHHGHHGHHGKAAPAHNVKVHPQPHNRQVHSQQLQRRPPQPQRRVLPQSPLKTLLKNRPSLPDLRRPLVPDLARSPLATLLRSSPLNGAVRRSQNALGRKPLRKPLRKRPGKKNPIQYLKAEQIPGYTKFELHDVIRAREGTEIFEDGEKPDVIHYVNSPEVGNIDLTDKIDERTPKKVAIKSEA